MGTDIDKWRAWKRQKKNKDFPLTPFACGQWGKKIRGKIHYFGILDDPQAALMRWIERKDPLLAGLELPTDGYTLKALIEAYTQYHEARLVDGRTSAHTIRDIKIATDNLLAAVVATTQVDRITPQDFSRVVQTLYRSGKRPRTIKNRIGSIRDMFSWAVKNDICEAPKYGPDFHPPSSIAIEEEQEREGVDRFIPRETILLLLKHADTSTAVGILLGINCAFYGEDSLSICLKHLHLTGPIPYHDFRRVKNKRKRTAVLWPETVEAIRQYLAVRKPAVETDRLLLTRFGLPFDPSRRGLNESFNTLCKKAGVDRTEGVSIGSLRHTYGTIVDLVADDKIVNLTMGHVDKTIQKRIYSQLNLSELQRLEKVANVVRDWLFYGRLPI